MQWPSRNETAGCKTLPTLDCISIQAKDGGLIRHTVSTLIHNFTRAQLFTSHSRFQRVRPTAAVPQATALCTTEWERYRETTSIDNELYCLTAGWPVYAKNDNLRILPYICNLCSNHSCAVNAASCVYHTRPEN